MREAHGCVNLDTMRMNQQCESLGRDASSCALTIGRQPSTENHQPLSTNPPEARRSGRNADQQSHQRSPTPTPPLTTPDRHFQRGRVSAGAPPTLVRRDDHPEAPGASLLPHAGSTQRTQIAGRPRTGSVLTRRLFEPCNPRGICAKGVDR